MLYFLISLLNFNSKECSMTMTKDDDNDNVVNGTGKALQNLVVKNKTYLNKKWKQ